MEPNVNQIESIYPLSHMQEGMLFHAFSAPGSGIIIEQIVCRFYEDLNVSAFKRAWQQVVERHEVFRTSFHWIGYTKPVQKVHRIDGEGGLVEGLGRDCRLPFCYCFICILFLFCFRFVHGFFPFYFSVVPCCEKINA